MSHTEFQALSCPLTFSCRVLLLCVSLCSINNLSGHLFFIILFNKGFKHGDRAKFLGYVGTNAEKLSA
jgi:hypothetical protein